MTGAMRRSTLIVLVLAVCAGPWGCALKQPRAPQSPTEAVRAQLNTIGLPVAGSTPETHVDAPTSGKGMGALKGAGIGLAAGATPGLAIAGSVGRGCGAAREIGAVICGAVLVFGLGVAAAGGTIGALGGTVYGAVTAESGSKIDAAQADLKSAVIQADIQMMLRDQVLQIVRDRSSLNFVAVDDQERSANAERIDYQALASTGIDTVLEVSVPRLGLAGQSGINPPVSLFMTARARLVRTADGAEMYAEKFDYRGGGASKFLEWAADDSQLFREEVARGTRSLADDIVHLLFPAVPARDSMPTEPNVEPPTASAASSGSGAVAPPSSDVSAPTYEMVVANKTSDPRGFDFRTWLPGNWVGSGGGYELTIRSNLTWEYTSTVRGNWSASGTARIEDPRTVVLEGWFRAMHSIGAPEGLTMVLHRYGESLSGEFRLSRTWPVTFSRAERGAYDSDAPKELGPWYRR